MFTEFFWGTPKHTAIAWMGMAIVVGYSFFVAQVKAKLNTFYELFYDLLGEGATGESGSGFGSGEAALADKEERVYAALWQFALIIAPLVSASPACKYIRSTWAFHWRMALMKAYLVAWDTKQEPIEGASQRLHEDTQRFAGGLEGCLVAVLDAGFTLVVFTPILVDLSAEVAPPFGLGALEGSWLWGMAFTSSLIGLSGAAFFGQRLVGLEVSNQRVEALLRKDLVLLETTPAVIVGTAAGAGAREASAQQRQQAFLPQAYFLQTLASLQRNYFALFKHFGVLNFWLSLFDQCMVILPYVLVAPLIFARDPGRRITLGLLVKVSNSFGHVFGSLSVVAENWGAINEFRSVLRRLREFEDTLYAEASGTNRLLTVVQMGEPRRPAPTNTVSSPPAYPIPCPSGSTPVVDGVNPTPEATTPRRLQTPTARRPRAPGLPIEIHVDRPPDPEDMRV